MKKRLHTKIEEFVKSLYKSIRYLYHLMNNKCYLRYNDKLKDKTAYILCNGPSLKNEINEILESLMNGNNEYFVVNNFAISDYFFQVRPKNYCIADRVYFWKETDAIIYRVFLVLNEKVDWKMNLYVPHYECEAIKKKIFNSNIVVIPLSSLRYEGFSKWKFASYKSGYAVPFFVNISIMAMYVALNQGCRDVRLYGMDHTFLRQVAVNDENCLCSFDEHFYGNELRIIPPLNDGTILRMKDFVYDKYLTFLEHDNVQAYANYLRASIVNCTKCSLVDSYNRVCMISK